LNIPKFRQKESVSPLLRHRHLVPMHPHHHVFNLVFIVNITFAHNLKHSDGNRFPSLGQPQLDANGIFHRLHIGFTDRA
jgi:hypothetical protein